MKLKVQHVMDSTLVLTNIINRQAPMPQRGKYLIARMHTKLLLEYKVIDARRDEMIKAYNNPQTRQVPKDPTEQLVPSGVIETVTEIIEGEWQVPPDKMPEFIAAWKVIGDEEIEVNVQALPLTALCMPDGTDGLIEASEFITLGELVYDNAV